MSYDIKITVDDKTYQTKIEELKELKALLENYCKIDSFELKKVKKVGE